MHEPVLFLFFCFFFLWCSRLTDRCLVSCTGRVLALAWPRAWGRRWVKALDGKGPLSLGFWGGPQETCAVAWHYGRNAVICWSVSNFSEARKRKKKQLNKDAVWIKLDIHQYETINTSWCGWIQMSHFWMSEQFSWCSVLHERPLQMMP